MSLFDGKPIKRVDFSPKPRELTPHDFYAGCGRCMLCACTHEEVLDNLAPKSCPGVPPVPASEQDRIWRATRAAAEASNISGTPEIV